MTVTIQYIAPSPTKGPEHVVALTRSAVEAIVAQAVATKDYDGHAFQDDHQFGHTASRVTAKILAAAAAKADVATALTLAAYVWHLRRTGYSVTVSTQEPYGWRDQPHLMLCREVVDAPSANWCAYNVEDSLNLLGLPFDSSEGAELAAADLAARCEAKLARRNDEFSERMGERLDAILGIARYALAKGGPQAVVSIG